jgi:hypothetical protein
MIMKNNLVLITLVILLLPSCKESKSKPADKEDKQKKEVSDKKEDASKSTNGYRISAPRGWTKLDTFMMGQQIVFLKSPIEDANDMFQDNVNVVTENTRGMELDKYVEANISSMESGLTGFEQGKLSSKNINGMDFRSLRYKHSYGGTPIEVEVYFTIRDGMAYIITCSAGKGKFSKWEEDFDEAVRSFEID